MTIIETEHSLAHAPDKRDERPIIGIGKPSLDFVPE